MLHEVLVTLLDSWLEDVLQTNPKMIINLLWVVSSCKIRSYFLHWAVNIATKIITKKGPFNQIKKSKMFTSYFQTFFHISVYVVLSGNFVKDF